MPFCEAEVYWEGIEPDWLSTASMAVFLWPLARAARLRQGGLAVLCLNLWSLAKKTISPWKAMTRPGKGSLEAKELITGLRAF